LIPWWWWCYPTPSEGLGAEGFRGDPTVGLHSKIWTRGQKMEVVPKMARRRGSDARQSNSRCTDVPHPCRGGAVPPPSGGSKLETDRYHFLEIDTDIFNFFTDIWPTADIRLVTDTDIPKFAY